MLPISNGRIGLPIGMEVLRNITRDDIDRLTREPITMSAPPTIQRLTARHHAMARLVASGKTAASVAIIVNYTPQRVRDLCRDPAFRELVAHYEANVSEAEIQDDVRIREKVRNLAEMAVDELTERMDDDDSRRKISAITLKEIAADGLDRTVLPKKTAVPVQTTPTQITFNIGGQGNVRETKAIEPSTIEGENNDNSRDNVSD